MATSNIKLFDENKGNMMGDTEYGTNTQRLNGVQQGIASSQLNNKFSYQTSLVAYALAQIMMQNGFNANDSDAVTTFVSNMSRSLLQKVTDKANKTMAEAGTDDSHFMTPLQVKYAIDNIFTSGFTVGGSGIILPGNPTNPLGAVPKQYVDASISGIKFPVSVTKIYDNQNFSMSKNYSSAESPAYAQVFYTFTQNDLMNYDIVIIQCKTLSFTITGAPSSSSNRYYVYFADKTKKLINVRLDEGETSYTLTPSGLVNNIFLTRSYDSYETNSFVDVDVSQTFYVDDSVQIYFDKSNRDSADLAFTAAITILGIKFI